MFKITITPQARKQITALQARLAELLEMALSRSGEFGRLTASQTKLEKEIARLEALDEPTDEQAGTLAAKRVQLESCSKKLEGLSATGAAIDVHFYDTAKVELRQFAQVVCAAAQPSFQQYVGTIAKLLRPYTISDEWAVQIAKQTQACVSLGQVIARPWGSYVGNVTELKAAIAHAEAVLAGELDWEFDPKK